MNIRRTVTTAALLLCTTASILGPGNARAATASEIGQLPMSAEINAGPSDSWGVNTDGWQVEIRNDSRIPLSTFVVTPFSNIDSRTGNLGIGHTAHVHGKKSRFEGPMNIDFGYRESGNIFAPGVSVKIESTLTYGPNGRSHISIKAACASTFSDDLECQVKPPQMSKSIQIAIHNTHP